jgi:hypothetical protein
MGLKLVGCLVVFLLLYPLGVLWESLKRTLMVSLGVTPQKGISSHRFKVLGQVLWLMSIQPRYKEWPLRRLHPSIKHSIIAGNYSLELNRKGDPASCILWGFVSKKELAAYKTTKWVDYQTAEIGRELIITHCISDNLIPFFRKTMKHIAKQNPDIKIGWGIRGFKNNKICKIILPRG